MVADQKGEFFTSLVMPASKKLTVNCHTKRAGYVQVGLVGVPGRSVDDCERNFGDHLNAPVTWESEIRLLAGRFTFISKCGLQNCLHWNGNDTAVVDCEIEILSVSLVNRRC